VVVHTYNPSYLGGSKRKITSFGQPKGNQTLPQKQKDGAGEWIKWQNNCLAFARPWIQSLVLEKQK
jgi:hypothetical protein